MATSADDLEQQLIQRLMSARATGASVRCAPMLVLSSEDIEIIIDAFHDRNDYLAAMNHYGDLAFVDNNSESLKTWRGVAEDMAAEMASMQSLIDAYEDADDDSWCETQEVINEDDIIGDLDCDNDDELEEPFNDLFTERRAHIETEKVLRTAVLNMMDGVAKDKAIAYLGLLVLKREADGIDENAYPHEFTKSLLKQIADFDEAERRGEVRTFTTLDEFFEEMDQEDSAPEDFVLNKFTVSSGTFKVGDDFLKLPSDEPAMESELTPEEEAERDAMIAGLTEDEQLAYGVMQFSMAADRQRRS